MIRPIVVVTGPEDLVPDQLTERLRVRGALPFGHVTAVHAGERRTTIVSTIVPLRLEYSPDAPSEAPTRLLLDRPGVVRKTRQVVAVNVTVEGNQANARQLWRIQKLKRASSGGADVLACPTRINSQLFLEMNSECSRHM